MTNMLMVWEDNFASLCSFCNTFELNQKKNTWLNSKNISLDRNKTKVNLFLLYLPFSGSWSPSCRIISFDMEKKTSRGLTAWGMNFQQLPLHLVFFYDKKLLPHLPLKAFPHSPQTLQISLCYFHTVKNKQQLNNDQCWWESAKPVTWNEASSVIHLWIRHEGIHNLISCYHSHKLNI